MKLAAVFVASLSIVCDALMWERPTNTERIVLANGYTFHGSIASRIAWYKPGTPETEPDDQAVADDSNWFQWEAKDWKGEY
jgi:hypothetical protein